MSVIADQLSSFEVELCHAVERSQSHNESVTVEVADLAEAYEQLVALYTILEVDRASEIDGTWDVWATDPDDDNGMLWRLKLKTF